MAGIRETRNASPNLLTDLRATLREMERTVVTGGLPQLFEADLRYHEAILATDRSHRG